jgi:sec-independent protein translocase protein TatA
MTPLFVPLFMGLGGPEIIFVVFIIMLLFGGKKIPELMKGIGKGVKSFKDGVSGLGETEVPKEKITDKAVAEIEEK